MADILQTVLPLILRHALERRDRKRRAQLEEQELSNAQLQQQILALRLSQAPMEARAFQQREARAEREHAEKLSRAPIERASALQDLARGAATEGRAQTEHALRVSRAPLETAAATQEIALRASGERRAGAAARRAEEEHAVKMAEALNIPKEQALKFARATAEIGETLERTRALKTQTDFAAEQGRKMGTGTAKPSKEEQNAAIAHSTLTEGLNKQEREAIVAVLERNPKALERLSPSVVKSAREKVNSNLKKAETEQVGAGGALDRRTEKPVPVPQEVRGEMRLQRDELEIATNKFLGGEGLAPQVAQQRSAIAIEDQEPGTLSLGDEFEFMMGGTKDELTDLLIRTLGKAKTPEGRASLGQNPFIRPDPTSEISSFFSGSGAKRQGATPSVIKERLRATGGKPTFGAAFTAPSDTIMSTEEEGIAQQILSTLAPPRKAGDKQSGPFGLYSFNLSEAEARDANAADPEQAFQTKMIRDHSLRAAAKQVAQNANMDVNTIGSLKLNESLQGVSALPLTPEDLTHLARVFPTLTKGSQRAMTYLFYESNHMTEEQRARAAKVVRDKLGVGLSFMGDEGFDALRGQIAR